MGNEAKLEKYFSLIDFWGEVCGPDYEILLHDVSNPDKSVLKIVNNHISSREVGSPLTDLATKLIDTKEYETKNFVTNYLGKTKEGRHLISSTYFIKEGNKLIGLICVNHDTHIIQEIYEQLGGFLNTFSINSSQKSAEYQENFDDTDRISDHMYRLVDQEIFNSAILPERMNAREKKNLVKKIYDLGVFSVRGTIPFVAEKLFISKPTVYRYINESKTKK